MTERISYLQLDKNIEAEITADREAGRPHPLRFRDEDVIRREDNPHDDATLIRPTFVRDIDKIVNIPAYNRYAGKTQVFSFAENDNICRRGLHVQLVSRVARTIGSALGLNGDLIEATALGHDIGHTPFGHAGERFLSRILQERTGRYFNHNVNSVRVLDVLYRRNVSLQVLDGALCHNGEFEQQVLKVGDTHTFDQLDSLVEACNEDEKTIGHLRPSTLEGCVVRVADMIAYVGKDRDDALDMGVIPNLDCFESHVLGRDNSTIINNLTIDIINNSYGTDRIAMSAEMFEDLRLAKRQNYDIIYLKEGLVDDSKNLVEEMFRQMYARLLEDVQQGREDSPIITDHAALLEKKSKAWTVDAYMAQDPDTIVCDYISSMTDDHFVAVYRHLFPEETRTPAVRRYVNSVVTSTH